MFCDKCGTQLSQGAQFCSACGKSVGSAPVGASMPGAASAPGVQPASHARVQRHIQLLATLWLVNGILRFAEVGWILIAGQMLPYLMGWGFGGRDGIWPLGFLPFGLYSIAGLLGIFGVGHLILAWGLFQREPWARVLGLVFGFLALLRPPLGTALGIYTLWVLLPQHSGQEYDRLSRATTA
jgi:zinc-ribbon domain